MNTESKYENLYLTIAKARIHKKAANPKGKAAFLFCILS